jgi:drug/metabolite transporter (DMT)-like permease
VAYSAYLYLLRAAPPSLAVSYAYVNPPVAVLFGVVWGHEQVGNEIYLALALIAGATALVVSANQGTKPGLRSSTELKPRRDADLKVASSR